MFKALLLTASNCSRLVKQTSEPLLFQTPPPSPRRLNVFTNSPHAALKGSPSTAPVPLTAALWMRGFSHFLSTFHTPIMTRAGEKESALDNISASHQESLSAFIRANCYKGIPLCQPTPYVVVYWLKLQNKSLRHLKSQNEDAFYTHTAMGFSGFVFLITTNENIRDPGPQNLSKESLKKKKK